MPKRVYITREMLDEFGFTARCYGCMSLLRETARQAHTEECRKRMKTELLGTAKAEEAQGRAKESKDRAVETRTKEASRTNDRARRSSNAGAGIWREQQLQRCDGSEQTRRLRGAQQNRQEEESRQRTSEDPERSDGKWMRAAGPKRKAEDEDHGDHGVFEETGQSRARRLQT